MKKRCECRPFDNLRTCVVSRPPLVLFTGCLLMVAAAFVYGGLYISTHQIENPDITWDWNRILKNMERVSFCIKEPAVSSSVTQLPQKLADLYWLQQPSSRNGTSSYSSYSASLSVAIYEPVPALFQQNVTTVVTSVLAGELGLKGNLTKEIVNITMFIHAVNSSKEPLRATACIVLSASEDVFPKTSLLPTQCHASQALPRGKNPAPGSNVDLNGGTFAAVSTNDRRCEQSSRIETVYESDPALTVMLTQTEKDLVYIHLISSSYFMFVMVLAVFIYGMVRSRAARLFSRLPSTLVKDGQSP